MMQTSYSSVTLSDYKDFEVKFNELEYEEWNVTTLPCKLNFKKQPTLSWKVGPELVWNTFFFFFIRCEWIVVEHSGMVQKGGFALEEKKYVE